MCAVFAEFEWNSISDRIKAGVARARKEGKQIGRPSTVTAEVEQRIRELRRSTEPPMGIISIAKGVGC
jgi:DNA invertase Pin-like site-specific DNA recombinase